MKNYMKNYEQKHGKKLFLQKQTNNLFSSLQLNRWTK
jgi:hypothetical protein